MASQSPWTIEPTEQTRVAASMQQAGPVPAFQMRPISSAQQPAPINTNIRDCERIPCYPEHSPQHHVPQMYTSGEAHQPGQLMTHEQWQQIHNVMGHPASGHVNIRAPHSSMNFGPDGSLPSLSSSLTSPNYQYSTQPSSARTAPATPATAFSSRPLTACEEDFSGANALLSLANSPTAVIESRHLPPPPVTGSLHTASFNSHGFRQQYQMSLPAEQTSPVGPHYMNEPTSHSNHQPHPTFAHPKSVIPNSQPSTIIDASSLPSRQASRLSPGTTSSPEPSSRRSRASKRTMARTPRNATSRRATQGNTRVGRPRRSTTTTAALQTPSGQAALTNALLNQPVDEDDENEDDVDDDAEESQSPSQSTATPAGTISAHDRDMEKWYGTQCTTQGCTNAEDTPSRKFISQFFGRNKAPTARIPHFVMPLVCRKCYQQRSYRTKAHDSFFSLQLGDVRATLYNCTQHAGDRDWTITLPSSMQNIIRLRDGKILTTNARNGRCRSTQTQVTNATAGDEQVTRAGQPVIYDASLFVFYESIKPLLGLHKTSAECSHFLDLVEAYCHQHVGVLIKGGLCDFELLPMGQWGTKTGRYVHDGLPTPAATPAQAAARTVHSAQS